MCDRIFTFDNVSISLKLTDTSLNFLHFFIRLHCSPHHIRVFSATPGTGVIPFKRAIFSVLISELPIILRGDGHYETQAF